VKRIVSIILATALALAGAPALAEDVPPVSPATPPAPPAPAPRVLSLEEALQVGLSKQPTLRQAQAATAAARARVEQARAPLLPQLTGSASYQSQSVTTTGPSAALFGASHGVQETYGAGLTGRLLIYDFGQTSGRWRASQASASGQESSEHATTRSVALAIRTAFFNAVAAKAIVGVAHDTLQNEQRHLEQVRAQVEIGTRPPVDLVQERVNVANDQVAVIQAENQYATARLQVEQAMGVTDLGPWEIAEETLPPVPGEESSPDVLLREALTSRPEIAAGDAQIRAQELTVDALQGGYGPSLAVQAGVTESGPRPSDLANGWNTQVTLTWPLFQGGLTRGQVHEAKANVTSLVAQQDLLKQQIRLALEQARLSVRAAVAALGAAADASQAARERLTLAEGRYQTGVGSILELSDAQVALTTALGQEVQAKFSLAVARSQLLQALGRA
jgi:outer membrane protein